MDDIKQIGTKVYYCKLTGNIFQIIGDSQGYVIETNFDEDCKIYSNLRERDKDRIGLLTFEFGEYDVLSKNSTGVMVDLKTKELIFTYDPLPEIPLEPSKLEILEKKIDILEAENADFLLDSAIKDLKIDTLEKDVADILIEIVGGI